MEDRTIFRPARASWSTWAGTRPFLKVYTLELMERFRRYSDWSNLTRGLPEVLTAHHFTLDSRLPSIAHIRTPTRREVTSSCQRWVLRLLVLPISLLKERHIKPGTKSLAIWSRQIVHLWLSFMVVLDSPMIICCKKGSDISLLDADLNAGQIANYSTNSGKGPWMGCQGYIEDNANPT